MEAADANMDSQLDFEEFLVFFNSILKRETLQAQYYQAIKEHFLEAKERTVFGHFCTQGTTLTKADFMSLLTHFGWVPEKNAKFTKFDVEMCWNLGSTGP